jgi:hypothetical protein
MSIINDALKKVQHNLDRQKKIVGVDNSAVQPCQKEKFSEISKTLIIASFLGSLLVLATFFLFSPKQEKNNPVITTEEKKVSQDLAQSMPPPAPPPQAPLSQRSAETKNRVSGLTLNGIARMGEEYVALINNKIVKEGDIVGDRKILSIDKDQVKVFDSGEVIILKLGGL